MDFIIEYKGKVMPVEVKLAKDITVIQNYSVDEAFVRSKYNVSVKDKTTYYSNLYVDIYAK